jgi:dihydropteroate synthase type 2
MVALFGILNVTADSFSDGGRWLEPAAAIAHGRELHAGGADVVDVGAESTHPDAAPVPAAVEIDRLLPVVQGLRAASVAVSVDTQKPEVMRELGRLDVQFLNDVAGFRSAAAVAAAAASKARLVVMFARDPVRDGARDRAREGALGGAELLAAIEAFFADRIGALTAAGVDRSRIVLDPGMGLFLGPGAEPSLAVLAALPRLRAFGLPLLVSVSRKSFLGALTGRGVRERGAATLAAELFAAEQGVDWIRTHEPRALRDALVVWGALRRAGGPPPAAGGPS